MYCLCVNVYCTTATGCQPNCSQQIYKYKYQKIEVGPTVFFAFHHSSNFSTEHGVCFAKIRNFLGAYLEFRRQLNWANKGK